MVVGVGCENSGCKVIFSLTHRWCLRLFLGYFSYCVQVLLKLKLFVISNNVSEIVTSCLWYREGHVCTQHLYGSCLKPVCERVHIVIVVPFMDL